MSKPHPIMHVISIAATYHKTLFMGKSITNQTYLQYNIDVAYDALCAADHERFHVQWRI